MMAANAQSGRAIPPSGGSEAGPTVEVRVPQFLPPIPRRVLLLAAVAFLVVGALLTLVLMTALLRQLRDTSGLPTWQVLLPLCGILLLVAELFGLFCAADALRTSGGAPAAEIDLAPARGRPALRPPRDVTDLPMQSAGGVVLRLEYAGLPALLLASILDEVTYAHQDAARRIAASVVVGLLDAAVLPPDKADRLTAKLAEDQAVTIDTISTRHSVTVVLAVGYVVLLGGANSGGKLIYEQLVKQVADETQAAMSGEVVGAVRRAVLRFTARTTERLLHRADLRITAQPWREEKARRQDRVISTAVLDPGRPAVLVWPAAGYEPDPPRAPGEQLYRRPGGERERRLSPPPG